MHWTGKRQAPFISSEIKINLKGEARIYPGK